MLLIIPRALGYVKTKRNRGKEIAVAAKGIQIALALSRSRWL
jgi:hypothetical protein